MGKLLAVLYGVVVYVFFFITFLYAIGFVENLVVPKTIDGGAAGGLLAAVVIDLALLGVFAVQHSVMARPAFKRWWTGFVPAPVERATYVLFATLALALIIWQWRPIPTVVWSLGGPLATLLVAVSLAGWGLVLLSTFLLNHFELFGLSQVVANLGGREPGPPVFRTPLLYRLVRHPLYLGFIIAFWVAPTMTIGHLLFAAATTAFIFVGIFLEERDLVGVFGEQYVDYRRRVAMLIPFGPK
jgi:protein-S-isoprenylcysteine O-methyltransferase Ste14